MGWDLIPHGFEGLVAQFAPFLGSAGARIAKQRNLDVTARRLL